MSGRTWSQAAIGLRLFVATPRLHGLAAINFAVAAAGSMVLVNTVVYVQAELGGSEQQTALALMFFGVGSLVAAMTVPRLLTRLTDRSVMLVGVCIQVVTLFLGTLVPPFSGMLALWTLFGIGNSLILTPSGRILRRSSQQTDRPALFAAQFALSHFGWLIAYPLAGWLGASYGLSVCFAVLGCVAGLALIAAWLVWPAVDEPVLDHVHEDLPSSHPHLSDAVPAGSGFRHAHQFVIDDLHHRWPRSDRV
ncbi:MAG: MFS transporter [Pseudomonadota bacterium]